MRLRHLAEYLLFQLVSGLFGLLSLSMVRRIAAGLGGWAYGVLSIRRSVALENLKFAFPDLQEEQRETIGRSSFRHVTTTLIELVYFPHLKAPDILAITSFEDEDLFKKLRERGKGIVLLTSHLGNWEILPVAIHLWTTIPVSSLYKPQSNGLIDRKIAERRRAFGTGIIPMGLAVRDILKALQQGEAVLMAADQSAPKESIWLNFFGRSIPVFQGPASFCLKTQAALVAVHAIRRQDGSFRLQCTEIDTEDLSDTPEGVRELTRRHVAATESIIRQFPDQWMWTHRRWKHIGEQEKAE